jgi:eukaryotic-like serine/threonine-protein kinase
MVRAVVLGRSAAQPRIVGRYLMFEAIASGGMATVHIGRLLGPEGFSRPVAIKQLHPQFARDPEFVRMLRDEARLASRVRHANVVSPLDIVLEDGELLVVMDFVQGESLAQLLTLGGGVPVPPERAAAIMVQVLLGLHAAHEATDELGAPLNLVHRDVSPQNVLVGVDGVARVVDFGIAKSAWHLHVTEDGQIKGKLGYMTPEQIRREPVDRRTDVFAAGIVLWEMVTGLELYSADNAAAALERILFHVPEAPSKLVSGLPPALDEVTLRALNPDVHQRWPTARSMAEALEAAVRPEANIRLGAWVEATCGSGLRARAERLAEIESLSVSELTRPGKNPSRAASPSVPPAPDPAHEPKPNRAKKRFLWVTLIGLTTAIAALAAQSSYDRRTPEVHAASVVAAARPVPDPALGIAPQPIAEVEPLQPIGEPKSAEQPKQPALKPRAPRQPRLVHAPKPIAAPAPVEEPEAKPRAACEVPYVIDAQGVKRFKPECF